MITLIVILLAALVIGFAAGRMTGKKTDSEEGHSAKTEEADEKAVDEASDTGEEPDSKEPEVEEKAETEAAGNGNTDGPCRITYALNNSWQDGSVTMYNMDWEILNDTAEAIDGWELELEIEGLSSVEGWNGSFECKGDILTVKNADYNGKIDKEGSTTFGCNLGISTTELKVKKAVLNGAESTVAAGKVDVNPQDGDKVSRKDDDKESSTPASGDIIKPAPVPEGIVGDDDWLHTDGRRILDKDGREVWLTGLNWFGYNTGTNIFDGLWNSQLTTTVKAIADRGFNLIRVPMSAQLLNEWSGGKYPDANYNKALNPELEGMNSLEIFDRFLELAAENGIKVMIDIHSAETDASGHNVNLWYTDKVSDEDYLAALKWAAGRYRDNDTIIAFDLKNEPHGKPNEGDKAAIWDDSKKRNNWKYMAERAALTVLSENPNVLIMVEGIEIYPKDTASNGDFGSTNPEDYYSNWWGGNLRGVRDNPVDLGKYQNKLVYSPHDYGPTVYEQPWFEGNYNYGSLMKDCWKDNWYFIYDEDIAPLLIGEWGGFMREPNLKWMKCMRRLISTHRLNHTFWCLNANSGDTGGLLLDDFVTWDKDKYEFVKEVLWQENGKFVGLDHEIPLGDNGICLSDLPK